MDPEDDDDDNDAGDGDDGGDDNGDVEDKVITGAGSPDTCNDVINFSFFPRDLVSLRVTGVVNWASDSLWLIDGDGGFTCSGDGVATAGATGSAVASTGEVTTTNGGAGGDTGAANSTSASAGTTANTAVTGSLTSSFGPWILVVPNDDC